MTRASIKCRHTTDAFVFLCSHRPLPLSLKTYALIPPIAATMQSLTLSPAFPLFSPIRYRRLHRHSHSICAAHAPQVDESPPPGQTPKLNRYSCRITEPKSQGAAQAILYGVGLNEEDMHKPQIGISSVWYEGNTCNMHLMRLSEVVKDGVTEAGMVGFRFNTVGVSDAISMGTRGMCYSLQSRDLIADSIETVMAGQWYDGNISIPGCDKNVSLDVLFVLIGDC